MEKKYISPALVIAEMGSADLLTLSVQTSGIGVKLDFDDFE